MKDDQKIDALRASILGTDEATRARFKEDTKDLEPDKKVELPVAVQRALAVLRKKQIPFLIISLHGKENERHAHFETTIEHPKAADMCHHIIESNRAAFWPIA